MSAFRYRLSVSCDLNYLWVRGQKQFCSWCLYNNFTLTLKLLHATTVILIFLLTIAMLLSFLEINCLCSFLDKEGIPEMVIKEINYNRRFDWSDLGYFQDSRMFLWSTRIKSNISMLDEKCLKMAAAIWVKIMKSQFFQW